MARGSRPRKRRAAATPAPLPPERRTIGQLIAEAIKVYTSNFARALPLGLIVAAINQVAIGVGRASTALVLVAAAPFFTIAYAYAARVALGPPPSRRAWLVALAAGTLVWVPAALLFPWFALAGILWLGLLGLAVPATIAEGTSFTESLRRGYRLGRADYVHSAGTLATLLILFILTRFVLALLLESQADNTVRTAIFLSDTVLAPLLFLGGALLYVDQEARLRSRDERREERDADVPDADHPDREGRPDAAREPGSAS